MPFLFFLLMYYIQFLYFLMVNHFLRVNVVESKYMILLINWLDNVLFIFVHLYRKMNSLSLPPPLSCLSMQVCVRDSLSELMPALY